MRRAQPSPNTNLMTWRTEEILEKAELRKLRELGRVDAEFLRGMKCSPCGNVGFAVSNSASTRFTGACLGFHSNVNSFGMLSEILETS